MKKVKLTQLSSKVTIDGYIWSEPIVGYPFILYKPSEGLDKYKKVFTTSQVIDIIKINSTAEFRTIENRYILAYK
jgi:hypothetical protein